MPREFSMRRYDGLDLPIGRELKRIDAGLSTEELTGVWKSLAMVENQVFAILLEYRVMTGTDDVVRVIGVEDGAVDTLD